jgi:hypothetical protein
MSTGENVNAIKSNKETLLESAKDSGLETNTATTERMVLSHHYITWEDDLRILMILK